MPTPFPPNKTIKELGVDTTRTFVATNDLGAIVKGDKFVLEQDDDTPSPYFFRVRSDGTISGVQVTVNLRYLAYADDEPQEEYVPKVGDTVSLTGVITGVDPCHKSIFSVKFEGSSEPCVLEDDEYEHVKLLSRKQPRRVTLAEVREKFGEDVEIIEE